MAMTRQNIQRQIRDTWEAFRRLIDSLNGPDILERLKSRLLSGSKWKRFLRLSALALVVAGVGFLFYCFHLSSEIERRFSARRWSIPSKVFSDTTILYPGQRIDRNLFNEKLHRLGYRRVLHKPKEKGEMRAGRSVIDLFLRDLELASRNRGGFPIRLTLRKDRIQSIVRTDNGESMPILELEPEEIALLFGPERERRQLISIEEVPPHVIHAVLSAEDKRFYEHYGFDPRGIARAFYANLRHGSIVQGGSTITQQLAKCYFLYSNRTLLRKLKEFLMSVIMEMKYEKDEILEIYLNEIYLGQNGSVSINGVGEASMFYFGKDVNTLSLSEAASIAGLIRAPNRYSPYIDKQQCRDRRDVILRAMHKNGQITDEKLSDGLASSVSPAGVADFTKKAPYFVDYLSEQLKAIYSPEDLASLGLSIFTALDTQVQLAAERALEKGLARLEESNPELQRADADKRLQGAIVVIQPKTGYILAMVGGRDYNVSQFNRISQARRQPGSAFKPFVYLSGLEKFTPAYKLPTREVPYELDGTLWEPRNFKPVTEQEVSLRNALAMSINVATVELAMNVGLDHIVETASSFQFSTPIKSYPSLSLGAFEVIPMEIARAYCAFAADGVLPYALSLRKVVDENGRTLEQRHMKIERVISPEKAYIMTSLLRSVVTDGTARSLKQGGISFRVAGKTGTTNDFRDAWFVGYTPNILALIWVGFDNEDTIQATGSSAALPIWVDMMNSIPQYVTDDWFKKPPGVIKRKVCAESGQISGWFCPDSIEEIFLRETVPTRDCPLHTSGKSIRTFIGG
jgi:penicillin-binding protein 1B